jgi:hypothetical protein
MKFRGHSGLGAEVEWLITWCPSLGVLPLIDITERFGEHPDVAEVAAHARKVMQRVLDRLALARRLPIVG